MPSELTQKPKVTDKSFSSTAAYLEYLSTTVMESHALTDMSILRDYLAPDFEMVDETIHNCPVPPSSNLEDHLRNTAIFKKQNPGWRVFICNVNRSMVKGANTAEVWMTCRGCDNPDDSMFNRESVSVLHWRRRREDGGWVCYRHSGIRGGGDFFP
ncbi:hypothetical protein CLAFUW7_08894 [Fulvia fulva]|nr:hypothetical protein CLAFUW7_08894 [Fulvia fulva]